MEPDGRPNMTGGTPTTLPGGQQVDVIFDQHHTTVEFPFHGVWVEIGIGPDPSVERSILDSIAFHPGAPDTSTLGTCPMPTSSRPKMPTPIRATAAIDLTDNVRAVWPAPDSVQPKISAAKAWQASVGRLWGGLGAAASPTWSITFGWMANKAATPPPHGTPAWLIRATPAHTDQGYCGPLVSILVDATTGRVTFTESGAP